MVNKTDEPNIWAAHLLKLSDTFIRNEQGNEMV